MSPSPYLQDSDFTLWCGDSREVLSTLPAESVHMAVTSPPFFGLRDYGTGTWEGGEDGCDHRIDSQSAAVFKQGYDAASESGAAVNEWFRSSKYIQRSVVSRDVCGKCGARRVDSQIGLEATPEEWVAQLVSVFEEVRRVLRKDGTLWVECGDSFNSGTSAKRQSSDVDHGAWQLGSDAGHERMNVPGLKTKDLIGQPFLLAFALREAGWYWRNVLIWHKPNPMPESVRDRFTVSHSYVLLFSKSPRYFFDAEAVREPHQLGPNSNQGRHREGLAYQRPKPAQRKSTAPMSRESLPSVPETYNPGGRNARSVWEMSDDALPEGDSTDGELTPQTDGAERPVESSSESASAGIARSVWRIPTEPLPFEHYAAFPQALAERCIKAGTSERGCCPECGAPWVREVESELVKSPVHGSGSTVRGRGEGTDTNGWAGEAMLRMNRQVTTTGWRPSCECGEYVCPTCDNDLDAGSGTTRLSGMRGDVPTEEERTSAVLDDLSRPLRDETPGQGRVEDDEALPGVRRDVHADASQRDLLFEDLCEPAHGEDSEVDQGLRASSEGLHPALPAEASDGESGRLRDGAPLEDGGTPGTDADEGRGRASRQRSDRRQPPREPGADDAGGTRSPTETAAGAVRVPSLRRDDPAEQSCPDCKTRLVLAPRAPVPAVVLDPFLGSGTSGLVSRRLGRRCIGVELNERYCELAAKRTQQLSILAEDVA